MPQDDYIVSVAAHIEWCGRNTIPVATGGGGTGKFKQGNVSRQLYSIQVSGGGGERASLAAFTLTLSWWDIFLNTFQEEKNTGFSV